MSYDFDLVPSRKKTGILNKWTFYAGDILPLWLADMDFPTAPQIADALQKQIQHGVLGYELLSKSLQETIARRMMKLYGWEVDPASIMYTAGANSGYNIAARVLCTARKGYLIQAPVYNEFYDTAHKTGVRQQVARLLKNVNGNQISYEVDFDEFEKEVKKVAMFLLCHPHNPVGKIYSPFELRRMAEICLEHDVTIVSDEIHSELLLGGAKFTPLGCLSPDIAAHTITLISAAKTFNVSGLSCAFAIIPDEKLRQRFSAMAESMSIEVSTPGLRAARVAFGGEADGWLKSLRRYLTGNRDYVIRYLEQNLPGVKTTTPDATFLLWLDCSGLQLKPSAFDFFFDEAKVALSAGAIFGRDCEQFVRLNFGTTRQILTEALERMRKSLR
jgi:cysteine-S-conjugate beta-lyase